MKSLKSISMPFNKIQISFDEEQLLPSLTDYLPHLELLESAKTKLSLESGADYGISLGLLGRHQGGGYTVTPCSRENRIETTDTHRTICCNLNPSEFPAGSDAAAAICIFANKRRSAYQLVRVIPFPMRPTGVLISNKWAEHQTYDLERCLRAGNNKDCTSDDLGDRKPKGYNFEEIDISSVTFIFQQTSILYTPNSSPSTLVPTGQDLTSAKFMIIREDGDRFEAASKPCPLIFRKDSTDKILVLDITLQLSSSTACAAKVTQKDSIIDHLPYIHSLGS